MWMQLVGREREMEFLDQCLVQALEGHPRVVLCDGPPGIGKTRLAAELLRRAETRGLRGVWGAGDDSAGAPPYRPWQQILRGMDKIVDLVGMARENGLAMDLAALAPEVCGAPDTTLMPGPADERFRQFDAVARMFGLVAARSPIVAVFDDGHAADQPSLLLLRHLARSLRDERVLVLVNYRGTEAHESSLLMELLRERVTRQVHLRGLPAAAVGAQLAVVVGHDVDPTQVRQVHTLTGGNPFFVAEVGRALADRPAGGGPLPVTADVQEAISARIGRLSDDSARLLRAGSIVGSEFSLGVVAAMIGRSVPSCLTPMDEAVNAGLVEPPSAGGSYRFAHALIRDALEAGLGTPERVRLHRLAAVTVEEFYRGRLEPHLFDLARHWAAAAVEGDRARATEWIRRAGEQAMSQHAYEEAARLFHLALDVCWGEYDAGRLHLLLGLGAALHLSSDIPGGLAACEEAADLARKRGRPDLIAEAALVTEPVYGLEAANGVIRQLCENALAALGNDQPELRVRVMARLAEACDYLDDVKAARPASEAALALAEHCGVPTVVEAALRARQLTCAGPDAVDDRSIIAERMLTLARETGSHQAQMWGHLWRIDVAFQRGDLASAARDLEVAARAAGQVRGPLARWQVLRSQGVLAQAQARFGDARRLADKAYATLAPLGHPSAPMMRSALLSMIAHHVGYDAEPVPSEGSSGDAAEELTGPTAAVIRTLVPAYWLFQVGRVREAAALYRSCGPPASWRPAQHSTLFCYANGIVLAAGCDASDDVAALLELLRPYAGHHVVSGAGPVGYLGPVDLWLGIGAAHLELFDDAVAHFQNAAKSCAVAGAAGFHAEVQYELAQVLARRAGPGDLTRARALVADSVRQADVLGMTRIAGKANELMERLSGGGSTLPLTPRELEVAELVTQGLTNREIASRLFLSERTAQNHVQHILGKLGLPNRSQIAVWVTSQRMSRPVE